MAVNRNELHSAAVSIVRKELSTDSAKIIRYSIQQPHSSETLLGQVGFGFAVWNLLAKNGIFWEEAAVFDVWVEILMDSVKASPDGHPPSLKEVSRRASRAEW
jgi:hypothetical protein